jgi:hypothetical protein
VGAEEGVGAEERAEEGAEGVQRREQRREQRRVQWQEQGRSLQQQFGKHVCKGFMAARQNWLAN